MLQAHPDNADALYVSALLSVQMGEWKAAQATLGRLRPDQRTPDMEALAADVSLNLQLSQAIGLGKRGQRREALTLLDRTSRWPTTVQIARRAWLGLCRDRRADPSAGPHARPVATHRCALGGLHPAIRLGPA